MKKRNLMIIAILISIITIEGIAYASTSWEPQPYPYMYSRTAWDARSADTSDMTTRGEGDCLIFHHTAWNFSSTSLSDCAEEIRDVQDYHMDDNGYADIGYHYVIDPSGRIWRGRSDNYEGAHTYSNNENIGIVVLGDFEGYWGVGANRLTDDSFDAMCSLSKWLAYRDSLDLPIAYNHSDFSSTVCPGRYMEYYVWDDLRGHLNTYMEES